MSELVVHLTKTELENLVQKSVEKVFFDQQPQNEYLTKVQACKFLNISPSSFTNYVNRGYLIKYKVDGKVYAKRTELEKLMESGRIG